MHNRKQGGLTLPMVFWHLVGLALMIGPYVSTGATLRHTKIIFTVARRVW